MRDTIVATVSAAFAAMGQLVGGLGTALLALVALSWLALTAMACLVGVGLLMAPSALRIVHALAARERTRLATHGLEIVAPDQPPKQLRSAITHATTIREFGWLTAHATLGLLLGLLGVILPTVAVRDTAFPLFWPLAPPNATSTSLGFGTAHSWPQAATVSLLGLGWVAIILGLGPGMAHLQARPALRLLSAGPDSDLSLRIAELTASRAAALDAHAVELRRIERSLHDGTQNRLVTVSLLIGAARRMAALDPTGAEELLERAQSAAEQALAELRTVARGILPPVLADRGLASALSGLAAQCAVPCHIEVDLSQRCATSVEATAYFVVAESLSNIAKHSAATYATVAVNGSNNRLRLRVQDNGRGGANEGGGSGISGIRRRIEALDGSLHLDSPHGGPTVLEVDLPCGS